MFAFTSTPYSTEDLGLHVSMCKEIKSYIYSKTHLGVSVKPVGDTTPQGRLSYIQIRFLIKWKGKEREVVYAFGGEYLYELSKAGNLSKVLDGVTSDASREMGGLMWDK
jgi:hypothetical protein